MGTIEDTKHPEDIELDALTLVLGYREKRYVLFKSWQRFIEKTKLFQTYLVFS